MLIWQSVVGSADKSEVLVLLKQFFIFCYNRVFCSLHAIIKHLYVLVLTTFKCECLVKVLQVHKAIVVHG